MEIFRQKLIVFNVILAFLDHLKPKIFLLANHDARHERQPFSEFFDPSLTSDLHFGKLGSKVHFLAQYDKLFSYLNIHLKMVLG